MAMEPKATPTMDAAVHGRILCHGSGSTRPRLTCDTITVMSETAMVNEATKRVSCGCISHSRTHSIATFVPPPMPMMPVAVPLTNRPSTYNDRRTLEMLPRAKADVDEVGSNGAKFSSTSRPSSSVEVSTTAASLAARSSSSTWSIVTASRRCHHATKRGFSPRRTKRRPTMRAPMPPPLAMRSRSLRMSEGTRLTGIAAAVDVARTDSTARLSRLGPTTLPCCVLGVVDSVVETIRVNGKK
mmetsp:Transcript_433/g.1316  ORF Transcript_433/g.1316 Transcript_433/m.1316 type:complete len:242 (-) Transcript_433:213-938(-)